MQAHEAGEWLETDGLGGFATGTTSGPRTRRYHTLLAAATTPPTGRVSLVAGFDAWVWIGPDKFHLTQQMYEPGVIHPELSDVQLQFEVDPWPHWTWETKTGVRIHLELFMVHGLPRTVLRFHAENAPADIELTVRPYLALRDIHSLRAQEDQELLFDESWRGSEIIWECGPVGPPVLAAHDGDYRSEPDWYRNFRYEEELRRGFDHTEALFAPGLFVWDVGSAPANLVFTAGEAAEPIEENVGAATDAFMEAERDRRAALGSPLERAADAYIVARNDGKTIVAGYPWFTDWGRDTFIALRGLCLATGRLDDAASILLEWSRHVSEGMLPNRFPEEGRAADYNSVDAALWFVVVADVCLSHLERSGMKSQDRLRERVQQAAYEILKDYAAGTRDGICLDRDGLLRSGEPGTQLTWMDACAEGLPVTPRVGKPVEIQALWINALHVSRHLDPGFVDLEVQAMQSFRERFADPETGGLYDVVDADHQPGQVDRSVRPNQIFAVGGLPWSVIEGEQARRVVDLVEKRLWTPLGLRSLDPADPRYCGTYDGDPDTRDAAYHRGTVWTWLLGPFVEAWVRVRGDTAAARSQARERFITPLLARASAAAPGHLPEIADGNAPHLPRGCPFQAWSVGEILRLEHGVLRQDAPYGATEAR